MLSLHDGPILSITIELNHHQVFRDHRCSPQRDRNPRKLVLVQVLIPQELGFSKDVVRCLRLVLSGMRPTM